MKEEAGVPKAQDKIRNLAEAQETVVRTARAAFPIVEKADDQVTADLLTQSMQVHEDAAWMLRSLFDSLTGKI